jgi:hypothetical protein
MHNQKEWKKEPSAFCKIKQTYRAGDVHKKAR